MPQFPRPPADVTPDVFFTQWLPNELRAQLSSGQHGKVAKPATLRTTLEGPGGGTWTLNVAPDGISGAAGSNGKADVTFVQSVQDWRALVAGEPGAFDLLPAKMSPAHLFVDSSRQEALDRIPGTFRFEVPSYAGRTWGVNIALGGTQPKAVPDATISIDGDTYQQILSGALQPMQAFFAGKIVMTGDQGLAMQLAMSMTPQPR